jgi:hypothetical protein
VFGDWLMTDESAWQLPAGASLENPDDLPYPWAQAKDGNGNTYYFHEEVCHFVVEFLCMNEIN